MEEPGPEAPREDVSTGVSSGGAAAGADDASLVGRSREPQSSPPHKSRRVGDKNNKNRGDDGRGRRPRKGDAKRERKKKALADSALQCQYYQDDHGLRRVRPYTYNFETHAKERWLGRTVIDVFSAEFGANPRSYYESVIRGGLLTVNGNKISPDYILQNSDLVRNRTHRHEPPVAGGDISIVSESPDEIAVDKPCTVPIHPCGSYRFNTLFYILQKQRPDLTLRVCHRLDRLTSGLTILAKTAERAGVIQTQIGSGKTRKTYLARVRGDFGLKLPAGSRQEGSPNTAEAGTDAPLLSGGVTSSDEGGSAASTAMGTDSTTLPVSSASGELSKEPDKAGELWWRYEPPGKGVVQDPARRDSGVVAAENPDEEAVEDSTAGSSTMDGKGCPSRGDSCGKVGGVTVRVNCPISVVDPKDGVYGCIPGGKEAQTVVRKVAYDVASDTSVVECTPVHGRTHQIRLHLQWAGHPIANDPCYGGELYFGDAEAKLRAEANSSTEGWKGTSRSKAAAAAAAAAAATAAEAAAAMAAAAAAIPIGGPDSESSELVKINGGETRTTVGVDAAAPIVDKATEGKGGGGGEGAGQDEGGGPEGSASGASRDKPSTEAEEMVAGGEDIEVQRDGEDDEAYMARTCHLCRGGERFTETQLHCHGIWLHALRYQGPDWVFETKMPSWATF